MTFKVAPPLILRTFMPEPHVKLATAKDVVDLIALVKEAHEEEGALPLKFDSESVFSTILRAMRGNAVIGVIANNEEIESACFLEVTRVWYTDTNLLLCLFFYSRPQYRKSSNSKLLLTWAREQAARLNCPLQLEVSSIETAKPKYNLCVRVLGDPAGLAFVYTPQPEEPAETPDLEVHPASVKDEAEVLDVARELAKENGAYSTCEELAIPLIHNALRGDGVVGVIRGPDKEIQGTIFLTVATPWYSSHQFLNEMWVHVRPQYRKSNNAKSLIQFAKHQADRLALPLQIGIVSKIELARKLALYQRLLSPPKIAIFST